MSAKAVQRTAELMEKLLVLELYESGASQQRIAKLVGRKKAWVNDLLRGLHRGGRGDGVLTQSNKPRT